MAAIIPSAESLYRRALKLFETEFGVSPEVAACAPGRVNLIGEHTDYNDGFVLPMVSAFRKGLMKMIQEEAALPLSTVIVGKANGTSEIRIYSSATNNIDHPYKVQFLVNKKLQSGKPKWANYIKGVIAEFDEGSVPGFDAVIVSSIPVGSGVSSSAALEVATYTFLEILTGRKTESHIVKALKCQKAEHLYAGVPCGIMDQLVSICALENKALLIDCRTLEITYVQLDDPEIAVLITNSTVKHELASSEYAIRRKQCEEAAKLLGKESLRDAVESDLLSLEKASEDKTVIARARHVITENKRTLEAAKALKEGDFVKFGKLMVNSHYSLKDDFQVSCKELDEIVEASLEVSGVFGSRMTGGGFGGCTVTLVKMDAVDQCIANIRHRYSGDPLFYLCKPSKGAIRLPVS